MTTTWVIEERYILQGAPVRVLSKVSEGEHLGAGMNQYLVEGDADEYAKWRKRCRYALHLGDAVAWLKSLPTGSAHLFVSDPAYESLEKHRAHGTTTRLKKSDASSNEWFEIFRNERFPELLAEAYRVLVDNAHCYVICDQDTMWVLRPMAEAAGFRWKKALIWEKTNADGSVSVGMGYTWRASHEVVCYLEKGKRRLNDLSLPDVLRAPRVRSKDAYPTEKPVELLEKLVLNSSNPGELVIDPFTGSASTGEAALKHGRDFAGCDLSPKSIERAERRLALFGKRW